MKIIATAAQWLFILCLPLLLLTTSIGWAVNSLWLYNNGFIKYNVSSTTGLAGAELEKAATRLIRYFNSNDEFISVTVIKDGQPFELFNQREILHLKDVKGLIRLDYWVLAGTALYALGYVLSRFSGKQYRRLAWSVVGGSSLTLALMLALGLGVWLNFDQFFWQFHLFSFANELWQLDPTRDYLIMLFPGGFWFDVTAFCVLVTAGLAIIKGGLAVSYLVLDRRRSTADPSF